MTAEKQLCADPAPARRRGHELLPFIAVYFCTHFFISPQFGYFTLFLSSKGLSTVQISQMMAISPLAAICGQLIWSNAADKAPSVNRIFRFLGFMVLCHIPLYFFVGSFWQITFLMISYTFFSSAVYTQLDTLTINYLAPRGYAFGRMRLVGSIAFLICMNLCGILADRSLYYVFVVQLVAGTVLMFVSPALPRLVMPRLKKAFVNPLTFLRRPDIASMCLVQIVFMTASAIHTTFYPIYYVNELGAPKSYIGLATVFSIAFEVVFLLGFDRMTRRLSFKALMLFSLATMSIRWASVFLLRDPLLLAASAATEGFGQLSLIYSVTYYFKKISPEEGKVSVQTLSFVISYSLTKITGNILGPYAIRWAGSMPSLYGYFLVAMAVCALFVIVTPVFFLRLYDPEPQIPR